MIKTPLEKLVSDHLSVTRPFKLAILIASTPKRADFLQRLKGVLMPQVQAYSSMVTVFVNDTERLSYKAFDDLLSKGTDAADYVAFIDDDDLVSEDYVIQSMQGVNKGVDCCSLRGIMTVDGDQPTPFEYSIKYDRRKLTEFQRYPQFWNCTRSAIAAQFKFTSEGVGTRAANMNNSGLLKNEHPIEVPIYYYEYRTPERRVESTWITQ